MARMAPTKGAFPRLDPELRRLRLYRIELIDMQSTASGSFYFHKHCKAKRAETWISFKGKERELCVVSAFLMMVNGDGICSDNKSPST